MSHILSLTSSPESGLAIDFATLYIGDCRVSLTRSLSDSGIEEAREGEEFEVMVLKVGLPVNGRPYSPKEKREKDH